MDSARNSIHEPEALSLTAIKTRQRSMILRQDAHPRCCAAGHPRQQLALGALPTEFPTVLRCSNEERDKARKISGWGTRIEPRLKESESVSAIITGFAVLATFGLFL